MPAFHRHVERLRSVIAAHPVAVVILTGIAWILPGAIGHDPWKPDEGYTFGIVYHMLQTGDWVIPTLAGEPFMEKPPLYFLTAALFGKIFAPLLPLHDGARLATAAYMGLTLLFVALSGRELYGPGRGWVAALMLLSCIGLVAHGHQLLTDMALLTGFAVSLYGLALASRRPRLGGFWFGTGIGIGFMSKGLLEPGIMGMVVVAMLAFPHWRTRKFTVTLVIALAAALPWLLVWPTALYWRAPDLFYEWFWIQNWGRFLGLAHLGPEAEPFFYARTLPWFALPIWPVAVWTLWRTRRDLFSHTKVLLPLLVFVAIFGVLSIAAERREVYALPMLLPLSLIAASGMSTLPLKAGNGFFATALLLLAAGATAGWICWTAIQFGVPHWLSNRLDAFQPGYDHRIHAIAIAIALFYTVAALVLSLSLARSPEKPLIAWVMGLALTWTLAMSLLLAWLDMGKSYRTTVAGLVAALPPNHRCIYSQSLGEPERALLEYFGNILTERLEKGNRRTDCDVLIIQDGWDHVHKVGRAWEMIWEGGRPGDSKETLRLYRLARSLS